MNHCILHAILRIHTPQRPQQLCRRFADASHRPQLYHANVSASVSAEGTRNAPSVRLLYIRSVDHGALGSHWMVLRIVSVHAISFSSFVVRCCCSALWSVEPSDLSGGLFVVAPLRNSILSNAALPPHHTTSCLHPRALPMLVHLLP